MVEEQAPKGGANTIALMRRGVFGGLAVGALVYVGFSLYAEAGSVLEELRAFPWLLLVPVMLLSLGNYALRFLRWHLYLRHLELPVPVGESLGIFLSGLSMTITPGKVGELLKSLLLRSRCGVPLTRSAPVVVAERVTDLLALVFWAALGVGTLYREGTMTVVVAGAVIFGALLVIQSETLVLGVLNLAGRIPKLEPILRRLRELYQSARALLGPRSLFIGFALGALSWGLECAGLWVVLQGCDVDAPLLTSIFIYAFATIAGVVSPGGLGVTDGLLVVLTTQLIPAATRGVAVAGAFIIRLATLWFAVGLGALVLLAFSGDQTPEVAPDPEPSKP